jgi:hypothetical protein
MLKIDYECKIKGFLFLAKSLSFKPGGLAIKSKSIKYNFLQIFFIIFNENSPNYIIIVYLTLKKKL